MTISTWMRASLAATIWCLTLGAWGQGAPVATSSLRGEICLNGVWRFMPAIGPAAQSPTGDWGQIPVPGSWAGGAVPGPTATGRGGPWDVAELGDVGRAWYETSVTVPSEWDGRAVLLELTRVSTDAVVYANDLECGHIEWPSGTVDITRAVRAGEPVRLRLLVAAVPEGQDVTVYMGVGNDQTWAQPAQLASRGVTGEAFLRSRPAGAHVSDVFARPSVRDKSLSLDVELTGVAQAGEASFTARMLDATGRLEKTFTAMRTVTAAAIQTVTLAWSWPDPRLWDLGHPELYTLQLAVTGPGLEDEYPQVFGFREFWLDGLKFYLNATEIRLRPACVWDEWNSAAWVPAAIDGILDGYSLAGFNLGEHWPGNEDERGSVYLRDLWAEAADRKGFLLTGCALSANGYIMGPGWRYDWDKPGVRERWERRMDAGLRRLRNHPSIVMWGTSANFFGRQQDQNPAVIGRRGWYEHDQKAAAGLDVISAIKRHDPTRPVFTHHGADIGDLHTCNCYLNFIPLQEREEWLSAYAEKADMPFLPIEFGTPLHCSFMRGRNGFGSNILSEPLMTEFCAIYLGDKAYTLETSAYRERVERTYQDPQQWSNWQNAPELDQAPAFQAVQDLFIRNTWRSWRTWGLTAGMVPWSMGHGWTVDPAKQWDEEPVHSQSRRRGAAPAGVRKAALHYLQPDGNWATYPAGQALVDSNSGTLAWIAGPPERFTAKDHLFESGEQISKQVVLLNDERTTQSYRAEWKIELDDRQTSVGERTGQIRPAENLFVPVSFTAPEVPTKSEGRIILEAAIGMRQHRDEFAFRVFPRGAPARASVPVLVFDPEGVTTRLLRDLGYALSLWDGQPHAGRLVVIGRHALDGETPLPGLPEKHVAAGGRLLILGQSPDWFRDAMGLRVAHHVSRRFFPVPSQSVNPILAGLDAEDFRDWRGAGTLVPETWGGLDEYPDAEPRHGWHWGNQGSVSSCAVEKPHYSGWRPILEGEFDLAYSPLMELSYGPGMAVLCTLDLEGRTQADPVARLVASRVVAYALQAGAEPRAASTVYIGGDAGRKLLRSMGLRFEVATQLPAGKALVVIGGDAQVTSEALESLLRQGGRALLLPRPPGTDPWGAVAQLAPFRGATDVPAWSECRGLSLSDLRLRGTVQMAPVAATGPVLAGAGGLIGRVTVRPGVAVMLQLSPDMLPGREKTYLRYSQWRLTRTLTQLLANLGGTFEMDARSLSPGWNQQYLPLALAGAWQFRAETVLPPATDPNVRTNDPGRAEGTANWEAPDSDTRAWRTLKLPGYWESLPEVGEKDGAFWLRREVQLPPEWAGQELLLQLGNVDDADVTWFNGVRVGETSGWNVPRSYRIPAKLVRAGRNVIAIRVLDEFGGGGFGAPAGDMRLGRVASQPVAEGEETRHNGDLADGLKGWNLGVFEPAQATAEVTEEAPPELLGQRAVRVAVTKPSETSWHVQLSQPGFGIQAGVHYVWSAWARASAPCSIIASIEKNHPPYGGAGLFVRVSLTPEWRRIRIDFTPRESDDNVRFGFQELAPQAVTYWFAAPSFMVAPDRSQPREVAQLRTFYSPDYIEAFDLGDDPYRYYRW